MTQVLGFGNRRQIPRRRTDPDPRGRNRSGRAPRCLVRPRQVDECGREAERGVGGDHLRTFMARRTQARDRGPDPAPRPQATFARHGLRAKY